VMFDLFNKFELNSIMKADTLYYSNFFLED
jgi:hypothetical protein